MSATQQRLTAWVHGHVQGVGAGGGRGRALELGLVGYAANQADDPVLVVAEGPRADLDQLVDWLRNGNTPGQGDAGRRRFLRGPARPQGFHER